MKKVLLLSGLSILIFLAGWKASLKFNSKEPTNNSLPKIAAKPLEKYTIENLSKEKIRPGKISILETLEEESGFNSYRFDFEFDPDLDKKNPKVTTGLINIPKEGKNLPLVLMLRGYVDQKLYKTGDGTRNEGKFFADNGFITIAPDFLGYAGSNSEAGNIFESRFQTYTTVLSLLQTLEQLKRNPKLVSGSPRLTNQLINNSTIFLWGHSNGGQIALTTLEIIGKKYPTTLWAPVSKPFPYSILYYTDESEDRGKLIRSELAIFEKNYDVDNYALDLYLDKIKAPLQIHQGTQDDAVLKEWSDEFVNKLRSLNKDLEYYVYPGADHNLRPNWNHAIQKDLEFFTSYTDQ